MALYISARATSAAPPYFKQFTNDRTHRSYLDGALYYNNPVRIASHERKLLWPDVADLPPDILLSIGTGYKTTTNNYSLRVSTSNGASKYSPSSTSPIQPSSSPSSTTRNRSRSREGATGKNRDTPRLLEMILNRVDSILDCDRAWISFLSDEMSSQSHRYQRLNLNLGDAFPKLDEKDKLLQLQDIVRKELKGNTVLRRQVEEVARQLVASSFFFERNVIPPIDTGNGYLQYLGMKYNLNPNHTFPINNICLTSSNSSTVPRLYPLSLLQR
jgi:hypothetical protein